MDWRISVSAAVLVGLGSGVVCAKEYRAFREAIPAPAAPAVGQPVQAANVASFPDVQPAHGAKPTDPAFELLASNPYEAQLDAYRSALTLHGENPLLEDPYSDAMRFANPYEHGVGIANPYVDALRESELRRQASLENPYTKRLRGAADVNLENPYSRRR